MPTSASVAPASQTDSHRAAAGTLPWAGSSAESLQASSPAPAAESTGHVTRDSHGCSRGTARGERALLTHQPAHPGTGFSGLRAELVSPRERTEGVAASPSAGRAGRRSSSWSCCVTWGIPRPLWFGLLFRSRELRCLLVGGPPGDPPPPRHPSLSLLQSQGLQAASSQRGLMSAFR